ncbi:MAG: hypothetical protein ACI87E_004609 [Mariniblastus sp.]|jgi:hypothetical protein
MPEIARIMADEPNQPKRATRQQGRFSIMSVMVVTAVFAASALSLGQLFRAAQGDKNEIGQFVIVTAMLPMVALVVASWFFKIFGRFFK